MADSSLDSFSKDESWSSSITNSDCISERSEETEPELVQDLHHTQKSGKLNDVVVSGWGDVDDNDEKIDEHLADLLAKWDETGAAIPNKIIKLCRKGIPNAARCQVWQILCGAIHDTDVLEAYPKLLSKDSPTAGTIKWDTKRTFVGHPFFKEQTIKTALYNICKAYSIYDQEVQYCQGLSFIAAVLLRQKMSEECAFAVLVQIMYSYGHRNLFLDDLQGLRLIFFQLDKLVKESLPDLHEHFMQTGIEVHMYATDWFLTLYTIKFPLFIVYRIIDIYLSESSDTLLLVALALLKTARSELLKRDFEGILHYLSDELPRKFLTEDDCQLLFHSVFNFKVSKKKMVKLRKDYQVNVERQKVCSIRMEKDDKHLTDSINKLKSQNTVLAEDVASSNIQFREEIDKLEGKVCSLSTSVDEIRSIVEDLTEELRKTKEVFQQVLTTLVEEKQLYNGDTREELLLDESVDTGRTAAPLTSSVHQSELELELMQTKLALAESCSLNLELQHRLNEPSSVIKRRWSFRKK